jgi:ribonuclease-3
MNTDLSLLEENLGYMFSSREFLEISLRHSSFVNELPDPKPENNERFEFLGDAVLSLIVSHLLMDRFPERSEGDLSKIRSQLVNEAQLSGIAKKIQLGAFLHLGRGELQTGGREKNSILADAFEALLAAVYLDGGFRGAFDVVTHHFSGLFEDVAMPDDNPDFKSRLQEVVQAGGSLQPAYQVVNETGPDHDKTFEVALDLGEFTFTGTGKSKKTAEQAAAKNAVQQLNGTPT